MKRIQFINGVAHLRADQVVIGDRLDLEGDKFADPQRTGMNPSQTFDYTFEFATVTGKERETPGCIRIDTDQGSIGFPPDHLIEADGEQPDAVFYDCGICEHYHPNGFHGDCRDDANRFTADELDERYNSNGWRLIEMEEAD